MSGLLIAQMLTNMFTRKIGLRSNYKTPHNYCSRFNGAFIFKERRMRRNKLSTVADYYVVKLNLNVLKKYNLYAIYL